MLRPITCYTETSGLNKIIVKKFMRNLAYITSRSCYYNGELYYRSFLIEEFNNNRKLAQSYSKGKPILGSRINVKA